MFTFVLDAQKNCLFEWVHLSIGKYLVGLNESVAEQAGLNLIWSQPNDSFSHARKLTLTNHCFLS